MIDTTEHPTADQRHGDRIEGIKLMYDIQKHVTTLSTASLLLLATLLEKFFNSPDWRPLIGVAFGGFLVSVVTAVFSMFFLARAVLTSGDLKDAEVSIGNSSVAASAAAFLAGALALIFFALHNFYK